MWEVKIITVLLGWAQLGKSMPRSIHDIYYSPNPSIGPEKAKPLEGNQSSRPKSISTINQPCNYPTIADHEYLVTCND